ncbi:MAG: hypothetical protein ACOCXG_02605 [Nanoarchaeota archaeon]
MDALERFGEMRRKISGMESSSQRIRSFDADNDRVVGDGGVRVSKAALDYIKYARRIDFLKNKRVYIDEIVGTTHGDYIGCIWNQVLLKRGDNLDYFFGNPSSYFKQHPEKFFLSQVNSGGCYVDGGGNHRTIIMKCFWDAINAGLFPGIDFDGFLEVDTLTRYEVDTDFISAEEELRDFVSNSGLEIRLVFDEDCTSLTLESGKERDFWLRTEFPGFKYELRTPREMRAFKYCIESEVLR